MNKNRLAQAIYRNNQKRNMAQFRDRLAQLVGIQDSDIEILEADQAFAICCELEIWHKKAFDENIYNISQELEPSEVVKLLDKFKECVNPGKSYVWLAHRPEFILSCMFDVFSKHAINLLDLDGDTVSAFAPDLTWEFMIDSYESERHRDKIVYEVDVAKSAQNGSTG